MGTSCQQQKNNTAQILLSPNKTHALMGKQWGIYKVQFGGNGLQDATWFLPNEVSAINTKIEISY